MSYAYNKPRQVTQNTDISHMKMITVLLIGTLLCMGSQLNAEEEKGIIGRAHEDGLPVIFKFVNEMPNTEIRNQLTWLTVISWKYDGTSNNGMPLDVDNQRMIVLEDTIENKIENNTVLRHVYSRTGNNLKELAYYIHDQEQFLESFNQALISHTGYPIEINFSEDKVWEGFQRVLTDFSTAAKK